MNTCMFAEVVCIPMCACTLTSESLHTSSFRIVIIELHMCTTRCSVRIVKHEPIGSQRIQFETLFSVMSWVLKSPWTVEFDQAFVIQLYEMNLRNTKSQLSLGINTLRLLG